MRFSARTCTAVIIAPALLATTALVSPADAQPGFYIGFGAGQADNRQFDDKDHGYKIFGGWRFLPNFAAELAYIDLGRYRLPGQDPGRDYDHYGVAAQLVAQLPLGPTGASLLGKAGLFSWYGYSSSYLYDRYGYYYQSAKDTGTDLALGAGLQFDVHRQWAVRAEWERFYDVAGGDIKLISASFLYRF